MALRWFIIVSTMADPIPVANACNSYTHTLILCYFTLFNILISIIPKSSDDLFPSGFMTEFLYYILIFSTSATPPTPPPPPPPHHHHHHHNHHHHHHHHLIILNLIMHTILQESLLSCVVHVPPLGQMTDLHTRIKKVKL